MRHNAGRGVAATTETAALTLSQSGFFPDWEVARARLGKAGRIETGLGHALMVLRLVLQAVVCKFGFVGGVGVQLVCLHEGLVCVCKRQQTRESC